MVYTQSLNIYIYIQSNTVNIGICYLLSAQPNKTTKPTYKYKYIYIQSNTVNIGIC